MKFTTNTQEFLSACNKAARAAQKSTINTSEMLLIKTTGPYGTVTGYNLTMGVSAPFGIESNSDEKVTVNAKILCGILKKAPSDKVELEADGDNVTIKSGRSKFTLKGASADEFPEIPQIEGATVDISADELNRLIRLTSFAAAKDMSRPQYTGVKMEFTGTELSCTALDGYRLARATVKAEADIKDSFIVPADTMNEVPKLLSGDIAVTFGNRHAVFYDSSCCVFTRLLDGNFVDFEKMLPNETITADVKRTALADAVERVSVTVETIYTSPIECVVEQGKINLSSKAPIGSSSDCVECDSEGEIRIGLNHRYLLDALRAADAEHVKIIFESPVKPVQITPCDKSDFDFLVLPVKLRERS